MTRGPGSPDAFCRLDLKTRDAGGAAAFFSAVLGWRSAVDEDDWRRATMIAVAGRPLGTVGDLNAPIYPPGTPPHIAYYLRTADVDGGAEADAA